MVKPERNGITLPPGSISGCIWFVSGSVYHAYIRYTICMRLIFTMNIMNIQKTYMNIYIISTIDILDTYILLCIFCFF